MQRLASTRRTYLKALGASSIGVAFAGCLGNGGDDELPTIRYAAIPGAELNNLIAMFYRSDEFPADVLSNRGETYELEFVDAQSTPVIVSTLGAGEADVGTTAYSSLANAIAGNAIEPGASAIAPLTYDGPRFADTFASLADSDITDVADIEGRSFAVNGVGSAIDIAARVVLTNEGIDPDDVEFRELSFGAIPETLKEGSVDVATFIQPFFQMTIDDIQPVFDTTDAYGSHLKIFATARNDFLEENREATEAWLADFWDGLQWWVDDANAEQRLDIAEEVVGLPRDLLELLIQTDDGYYHGEDGLGIDPQWVQKPVDGMAEVGFLDEELDMAEHIDTSFLPDEANTEPPL